MLLRDSESRSTGSRFSMFHGPQDQERSHGPQDQDISRFHEIWRYVYLWILASGTGILYLARRSKYHLSIWPLSRGELIPRLDEFIFFVVSQFLLQVLSRSFAPLPPSLNFSSFFPHPGRGIFPSLPGITTHACFLKRCAQCC